MANEERLPKSERGRREEWTGPDQGRENIWDGPYGRGYAEQFRRRDRYGFVDQHRRYGRRGDYRGWSERGYDRDDAQDLAYGFGTRPAEGEDYQYQQPWMVPGPMSGLGPRGYDRSDENIFDDVNEELMRNGELDASQIEVSVDGSEVLLRGNVPDRYSKRLAERLAARVPGVYDVHNRLIIQRTRPQSPPLGPGQGRADLRRPQERRR